MKNRWNVLTILFFLLCFAGTVKAQKGSMNYLDQYGFNGIRIDGPLSQIPAASLRLLDKTAGGGAGDTYLYTDTAALRLSDKARLDRVEIISYRGEVSVIRLYVNRKNLKAVTGFFRELYGATADLKPDEEYRAANSHLWFYDKRKNGLYEFQFSDNNEQ